MKQLWFVLVVLVAAALGWAAKEATEKANRMSTSNNLHQSGIAIHNSHHGAAEAQLKGSTRARESSLSNGSPAGRINGAPEQVAQAQMRENDRDGLRKAEAGLVQATVAKPAPRKIRYTAQVELLVEDLDMAEIQLRQLIKEQDAYIIRSEIHGSLGEPRSGSWTVRVPVDNFNDFVLEAAKLGELRVSTTDSQDITDQYYDLKAHLKNNQVEEQGLQKLLVEKSAAGKLEDLLAVRRELRAVRGAIEQEQGQLQRWEKETEYATVTVVLYDRKDYVPETAPPFSTSIGRTLEGSIGLLVDFGKRIVLAAVALAPWLPIAGIVLGPCWWALRRRARLRRRASPRGLPHQQTPGAEE